MDSVRASKVEGLVTIGWKVTEVYMTTDTHPRIDVWTGSWQKAWKAEGVQPPCPGSTVAPLTVTAESEHRSLQSLSHLQAMFRGSGQRDCRLWRSRRDFLDYTQRSDIVRETGLQSKVLCNCGGRSRLDFKGVGRGGRSGLRLLQYAVGLSSSLFPLFSGRISAFWRDMHRRPLSPDGEALPPRRRRYVWCDWWWRRGTLLHR